MRTRKVIAFVIICLLGQPLVMAMQGPAPMTSADSHHAMSSQAVKQGACHQSKSTADDDQNFYQSTQDEQANNSKDCCDTGVSCHCAISGCFFALQANTSLLIFGASYRIRVDYQSSFSQAFLQALLRPPIPA